MKGLNRRISFGYGSGTFSEAGFYQFVNSFQLVFLTSIVGIGPAVAGTIVSVTVLMDAIGTMFIGHFSDNLRCKYGRRRPLILFSTVFNPIIFLMCFVAIRQPLQIQFAYYVITGMLFWISYSLYYIPYSALGAEITTDYDDRIELRSISRMFSVAGSCFATVVPLTAIEMMTDKGLPDQVSWFVFCAVFALILGVSMFICWNNTRGFEKENHNQKEKINLVFILKDFIQIMKLKVMYMLVISKVVFMFGYTLYTAGMMFFMHYKLGLSGRTTATLYLFYTVLSFIFTPVILKLAVRFDKKKQMLFAFFLTGACGMALSLIGVESYWAALLWVGSFAFANSTFWQLSNAMFYDVTEVDELVNGVRREGSITSLQCLWGTLTSSLSLQIVGLLLKANEFQAAREVQTMQALSGIERIFITYPAIALMIGSSLLILYPMDRKKFETVRKALERKKNNLDYSEYGRTLRKLI